MKRSSRLVFLNTNGITLIALVVSIIVLLILAGISISMLSGNNGILTKAIDSKNKNTVATEKEQLQLAVMASIETNGSLSIEKLKGNIEKDIKDATHDGATDFPLTVTYTETRNVYEINSKGNVEKAGPQIEIADSKVVTNLDGTGEDVAENSKEQETDILYISFKASISSGTITSVIYSNGTNNTTITPTSNGIYVLEINKNGDYSFLITATAEGENITKTYTKNVNKYSLRAGINVGDYVTYNAPTRTDDYTGFTKAATGYKDQTLGQEYNGTGKWRILKKYEDGSLDIVAAVTSSNKGITFKGAVGWNNAVFLLDDACKYLYANEEKGITARSIDLEDITSKMIQK